MTFAAKPRVPPLSALAIISSLVLNNYKQIRSFPRLISFLNIAMTSACPVMYEVKLILFSLPDFLITNNCSLLLIVIKDNDTS